MSYSTANGPENWGAVHLEGDDDLSMGGTYVRSVGMGIEGRPADSPNLLGASGSTNSKAPRRVSAMSWSSGKGTIGNSMPSTPTSTSAGKARQVSTSTTIVPSADDEDSVALDQIRDSEQASVQRRTNQLLTTMALLQTFHAHTLFQLSVLEDILTKQGAAHPPASDDVGKRLVTLTPKDILAFELGPLSSLDARYLEWLVEEYAGSQVKVVIKRGWKDLLGAIFGYG